MTKFFISFSSSDRRWVRGFRDRLQRAFPNVDIFVDESAIQSGDDWWRVILQNIADSSMMLFVLSAEFFESKYCRAEYLEALRLDVPMLALLVRPKIVLPFEFSSKNYVDMTDWFGDSALPEDIYPPLVGVLNKDIPARDKRNSTPHPDREEPADWDWPDLTPSNWGHLGRVRSTNGNTAPPSPEPPPAPKVSPFDREAASAGSQDEGTDKHQSQGHFEIRGADWVQLGCIAFFGVEDMDIIRSLSEKLTALSNRPTEPYYSRMGEPVPAPDNPHTDIQHATFSDIDFAYREKMIFDKVFIIVYFSTHTAAGKPAYAYVNVRGDRLENLLGKATSDVPFNLSDYATLVEVGVGHVPLKIREKLMRDYLFGETQLNVRLFPPLSEVT